MSLNCLRFGHILLLALSLVSVACGKQGDDNGEQETGYCIQLKDQVIKSTILGHDVKYNVLLPPDYSTSGSYKVIYLLHGMGGDNSDWCGKTRLAGEMRSAVVNGTIPKTVVVMPQAWNLFYMDAADYKKYMSYFGGLGEDYESFFFKEFIPAIEKQFNVDPARGNRAIAGLSMGGFGAAYYGIRHPEMFCYVYTMSQAAMEPLYSLVADSDKNALPFIFVANGTEDKTVGEAPQQFHEYLKSQNARCGYEGWGGGHDWKFWGECVPKFLAKIGEEFNK